MLHCSVDKNTPYNSLYSFPVGTPHAAFEIDFTAVEYIHYVVCDRCAARMLDYFIDEVNKYV